MKCLRVRVFTPAAGVTGTCSVGVGKRHSGVVRHKVAVADGLSALAPQKRELPTFQP